MSVQQKRRGLAEPVLNAMAQMTPTDEALAEYIAQRVAQLVIDKLNQQTGHVAIADVIAREFGGQPR